MTIFRHPHSDVSYLLQRSYESVHVRLREILSPEEAAFFAATETKSHEQSWFVESTGGLVPFSRLAEDEKSEVSDLIQEIRTSILPKLLADKQLKDIANDLFIVPSENSIQVSRNPQGHFTVTLTQWACRDAMGDMRKDVLSIVVNRPKPDHTTVNLQVSYTDGPLYAGRELAFFYKDRVKVFRTNDQGEVHLGRMKNGSIFSVAPSADPAGKDVQSLSVVPGQELYPVSFPFYQTLSVAVRDQKGNPVPGAAVEFGYGEKKSTFISDGEGMIILTDWIYKGGALILSEPEKPDSAQSFDLPREERADFVFQVFRPVFGDLLIRVLDQNQAPYAAYPVNVSTPAGAQDRLTDAEGKILISGLQSESHVRASDGRNPQNSVETTTGEGPQELVLRVERPAPEIVRVRLLDRQGAPMEGIPMDFALGANPETRTTDAEGICRLEKELFGNAKRKVPLGIHLPGKNGKSRILRKKLRYTPDRLEYTLKLTSYRWLLWLLLLLLPLLLLIKCEKEASFQVVEKESGAPVPNTEVHFSYVRYALFDQGRFLPADSMFYTAVSDTQGMVKFDSLGTTVYGYVFRTFSKAYATAANNCYASDGVERVFHWMSAAKVKKIKVSPIFIPLDFLVVDRDDNQPLPDAKVWIWSEINGQIWADSAVTDPAGKVVFSKIPKCGRIARVEATAEGYYPDSLKAGPVENIAGGTAEENRKIPLRPIRKKISFFVTNCNTGEPLPGAKATIYLNREDGSKSQKVSTNINGVGKGEYDDIHIINLLKIVVTKPYFKDGVWDKGLTVGEFVQLPDSQRVICLEPLDLNGDFQNIDSLTRKPLAGVKNVVSIARGGKTTTDTIYSNKNGAFTIPGLQSGDKLTVHAFLEPHYEPNLTTISGADVIALLEGPANRRIIPLKPKELEVTFRTVDPDADTLVDNASLMVVLDGNRLTNLTNSGNGVFTVKGFFHSVISIAAEKQGYQDNNTKINNKAFNVLASSPQAERDIPLTMKPCNTSGSGNVSGQEYYLDEYNMGASSGSFKFIYYTDTHPDEINVYCGRKDQISPSNRIFHYLGATGYQIRIDQILRFNNCQVITVEVKGGSEWEYTVNCPD